VRGPPPQPSTVVVSPPASPEVGTEVPPPPTTAPPGSVAPVPPPASESEMVPTPSPNAGTVVWQPGHWAYTANTLGNPWTWIPGRYVTPPRPERQPGFQVDGSRHPTELGSGYQATGPKEGPPARLVGSSGAPMRLQASPSGFPAASCDSTLAGTLARSACHRRGEPIEFARGDHNLFAAEVLDDALLGAAILAHALDEVEVGACGVWFVVLRAAAARGRTASRSFAQAWANSSCAG
jgi:hypothetical protein